ncbi:MAG: hypothetical protein ACYTG2_00830 [Planctomycetota bacterium]|jgi:hypothetical protein
MVVTLLEPGDVVLAVHRRLFDEDPPRFFLGRVEAYTDGVARVAGQTWVFDEYAEKVLVKEGQRKKLLALASGTLIVYQLDREISLEQTEIVYEPDGSIWLTDHHTLRVDLSERPKRRA